MSHLLPNLLQIARVEMPSLQHDIQNASTLFTLQSATQRLYNVVAHILHDVLIDAETRSDPALNASIATVVPPPAPRPAPAPAIGGLLPLSLVSQPVMGTAVMPGMPDMTVEAGVTNVVVTPQGTRVIGPQGGPAVTLPPNTPVSLPMAVGQPVLPTDENGVPNVVVQQGGAMTPEVAAALAARPAPTP